MDKETAKKLLAIANDRLASGEMLSNRLLIDPKNELEAIKKRLCSPFVVFFNKQSPFSIEQFARMLEIPEQEIKYILYYHFGEISLDQIVLALSKLAQFDQAANKVLIRLASSA